ncbi:MAG: S-methyl-5'-thioadenosine phosphorylase, partial [Candidatus Puniceispirillum sp.]
ASGNPLDNGWEESLLYKDVWHCDVIGMTNMPEAKLAREAEICYATIAMITDYDCWHPEHDNVEVSDVIAVLKSNANKAKDLVKKITSMIDTGRDQCPHGCDTALEHAIISNLDEVPQKELDRLAGLIAKNLERHRSRS